MSEGQEKNRMAVILSDEYKKRFVAVHVRKALLRLAIEQPKVILEKEGTIIDTVVSLARDYAESILKLKETPREQ